MTEGWFDSKQACDDLAEPMGQLLGSAAAVPAFAGAALPFVETGLGAIMAGSVAAYSTYDTVHDAVANNWSSIVCEPLADAVAPEPGSSYDWSTTDPFSSVGQSPFQPAIDDMMARPVASVTFYDTPNDSSVGSVVDSSSAFEGFPSYDSGGGSSSDSSSGASSD